MRDFLVGIFVKLTQCGAFDRSATTFQVFAAFSAAVGPPPFLAFIRSSSPFSLLARLAEDFIVPIRVLALQICLVIDTVCCLVAFQAQLGFHGPLSELQHLLVFSPLALADILEAVQDESQCQEHEAQDAEDNHGHAASTARLVVFVMRASRSCAQQRLLPVQKIGCQRWVAKRDAQGGVHCSDLGNGQGLRLLEELDLLDERSVDDFDLRLSLGQHSLRFIQRRLFRIECRLQLANYRVLVLETLGAVEEHLKGDKCAVLVQCRCEPVELEAVGLRDVHLRLGLKAIVLPPPRA